MTPAPLPFTSFNTGLDFGLFEGLLKSDLFEMPIRQVNTDYFPEFLATKLDNYVNGFERSVVARIDGSPSYFDRATPLLTLDIIKTLSTGFINAVNKYYEGNVSAATKTFDNTLDSVGFMDIANISTIELLLLVSQNITRL